ncbi:MAG: TetR/AcrR family transcriptional regulator [Pseudomonadota bacterium]
MIDLAQEIDPKREEIRFQILGHAEGLFRHYGFGKTSVNDIARAAGMSSGNLYRFFRNKQAIGVAVVAKHFEREVEVMAAAAAADGQAIPEETGPGAEARIRRMLRGGVANLVDAMRDDPKILELAELICEDQKGIEMVNAYWDRHRAAIAEHLRRGNAEAEFSVPDVDRAAGAMINAVKVFWTPFTLARRNLETVDHDLTAVLDLIFLGARRR